MPEADRDTVQPVPDAPPSAGKQPSREDFLNEEEKILAGRTDVNMPAVLTKDVPGG